MLLLETDCQKAIREHENFMVGNIKNLYESIKNFEHHDEYKILDFIV